MDELIAFVRQQLDEDERVARAAARHDVAWLYVDSGSGPTVRTGTLAEDLWSREGNPAVWTCDDVEDGCPDLASAWEAEGRHIAHWDPARMLAEVEAKRRVLDLHASVNGYDPNGPVCSTCGEQGNVGDEAGVVRWPCPTVRLLAQPYAGREDWREEWRA